MVLVVDSGSTKTAWQIIDQHDSLVYTSGINPYLQDIEGIKKNIQSELQLPTDYNNISKVFFYGAGCSTEINRNKIKDVLQAFFSKATIQVEHDLLGAARACLGSKSGIACILGTGSNSCLYNGKNIIANSPSLGYVLGDEGSGCYIGKELAKKYLYRELSDDLSTAFEKEYHLNKEQILDNVYKEKFPNRYLAGFTKFVKNHIQHKEMAAIVEDSFEAFVNRHILTYPKKQISNISFVGSIAHYFKDILESVLENHNLSIDKLIQSPIEGLVAYHKINLL